MPTWISSRPGARRRLQAALLVAVLTLTAAGIWVWRTTSTAPPACVSTAGPANAATRPVAAPPTGLRVVEKGFSQLTNEHRDVLVGAVLENTSSLVAYRVPVTFRVTDQAGRPIDYQRNRRWLRVEIPVVMPGQRIGVGTLVAVDQDERTNQFLTAAAFTADVGMPQWWPRLSRGHTFAEVTTQLVRVPNDPQGYSSLHFTIQTRYCETLLRRGVVALYRSANGTLLGGSIQPDGRGTDPQTRAMCPPWNYHPGYPATSQGLAAPPPGADDTRTEIYEYCDVTDPPEPTTSAASATAPIN